MKYESLADLINAVHQGEQITLMIDNDDVFAVTPDGEDLFEMHPTELLEEALDLLQLQHESV